MQQDYEELRIPFSAPIESVKLARRNLVKGLYPTIGSCAADLERFIRINLAYARIRSVDQVKLLPQAENTLLLEPSETLVIGQPNAITILRPHLLVVLLLFTIGILIGAYIAWARPEYAITL
jgi:hypothetical protein